VSLAQLGRVGRLVCLPHWRLSSDQTSSMPATLSQVRSFVKTPPRRQVRAGQERARVFHGPAPSGDNRRRSSPRRRSTRLPRCCSSLHRCPYSSMRRPTP